MSRLVSLPRGPLLHPSGCLTVRVSVQNTHACRRRSFLPLLERGGSPERGFYGCCYKRGPGWWVLARWGGCKRGEKFEASENCPAGYSGSSKRGAARVLVGGPSRDATCLCPQRNCFCWHEYADSHGHPCTYRYADFHKYADSYQYADSHGYPHAQTYLHTQTNLLAYSYAYAYGYPHRHAYGYPHSFTHLYTDCDCTSDSDGESTGYSTS